MSYYKYVGEQYKSAKRKTKKPDAKAFKELMASRKQEWRASPPIERVEHPTRIDKARRYGFKAKQGFSVVRVRIRRGAMQKQRPVRGRKPKRMGVTKITPKKSLQRIAEERAYKKHPNMEVLGSYWLWEDGKHKWFEVILVDPSHPAIKSDRDINWICEPQHHKRVLRGLTPAGKTGRGLKNKGKGAEKLRPSIKAHGRRGK